MKNNDTRTGNEKSEAVLVSMVDFVLNILNQDPPYNEVKMLTQISNYANFLKQPLAIGMFVPCDLDGNVLTEPSVLSPEHISKTNQKLEAYQQAKERCLFEGFQVIGQDCEDNFFEIELIDGNLWIDFVNGIANVSDEMGGLQIENIEYLVGQNLRLTESARKQIGI